MDVWAKNNHDRTETSVSSAFVVLKGTRRIWRESTLAEPAPPDPADPADPAETTETAARGQWTPMLRAC